MTTTRILHTSDWHLGRTLHGVDLRAAHEAYFDHLLEVVRSAQVDAVIVSGDVYDRGMPPVASVQLLSDALERLTAHTRVILTPGNHDSAIRLGFASALFSERVAIRSTVAGIGAPFELPDAHGRPGALIYALPYLDPDATRGALNAPARSHQAVLGAAMARVRQDLAARRAGTAARVPALVMAHAFVTGGEPSDSERDIRVGGVDRVAAATFTGVDYAALGHLHGAQQVAAGLPGTPGREGAALVRYSGSPVAFSFSEVAQVKSSVLLEFDAGGVRTCETIAAPVLRPLAEVRGTLAELQEGVGAQHKNAYTRVTITDDVRPERLHDHVRALFDHPLEVLHAPTRRLEVGRTRQVTAGTDPMDVLADFVHDAGGAQPTDRELEILRDAYESVLAARRSA